MFPFFFGLIVGVLITLGTELFYSWLKKRYPLMKNEIRELDEHMSEWLTPLDPQVKEDAEKLKTLLNKDGDKKL